MIRRGISAFLPNMSSDQTRPFERGEIPSARRFADAADFPAPGHQASLGSSADRFLDGCQAGGTLDLSAELTQADRFLDDPTFLAPLARHLDPGRGRPALPMAQVLRLFYLQDRYGLSDRVLAAVRPLGRHGPRPASAAPHEVAAPFGAGGHAGRE